MEWVSFIGIGLQAVCIIVCIAALVIGVREEGAGYIKIVALIFGGIFLVVTLSDGLAYRIASTFDVMHKLNFIERICCAVFVVAILSCIYKAEKYVRGKNDSIAALERSTAHWKKEADFYKLQFEKSLDRETRGE